MLRKFFDSLREYSKKTGLEMVKKSPFEEILLEAAEVTTKPSFCLIGTTEIEAKANYSDKADLQIQLTGLSLEEAQKFAVFVKATHRREGKTSTLVVKNDYAYEVLFPLFVQRVEKHVADSPWIVKPYIDAEMLNVKIQHDLIELHNIPGVTASPTYKVVGMKIEALIDGMVQAYHQKSYQLAHNVYKDLQILRKDAIFSALQAQTQIDDLGKLLVNFLIALTPEKVLKKSKQADGEQRRSFAENIAHFFNRPSTITQPVAAAPIQPLLPPRK